jgi:hypothetical protein
MNKETLPGVTSLLHGGVAYYSNQLVAFYSEFHGKGNEKQGHSKWTLPLVTGAMEYDAGNGRWKHMGIILDDFLANEGTRKAGPKRWIMAGETSLDKTQVAYTDSPALAPSEWRKVNVPKGEGKY